MILSSRMCVLHRTYLANLLADNSSYIISAQTRFTTTEHYDSDFIFEAPTQVTYQICPTNTYGGFNGSGCQPCPTNSVTQSGVHISDCECEAGYNGQNGGPCTGMSKISGSYVPHIYVLMIK